MKKEIILILFFLLYLSDQALASSITQNRSTGTRNINVFGYGIGQTFVATSPSFSSISVDLYPSLLNTVPDDSTILFGFYQGLPSGSMASLIPSGPVEINISSLGIIGGGTLNIDISSFLLTIGSHYSFALLNDTSDWSTAYTNDRYDYYDQGDLFIIDKYENYHVTTINSDMKFSINTPVPAPSSLLLLASGLSMLPIFRKKFHHSRK